MASNSLNDDLRSLVERARAAAASAYAPYSQHRVGAAVRCGSGRVYVGCNVESASYPVTLCAERNAIGTAVAGGEGDVEAIAVVGDSTLDTLSPCGMCRQFIAEFGPAVQVVSFQSGEWTVQSIGDLLPVAFTLDKRRRGSDDRVDGPGPAGSAPPVAGSTPASRPGFELHRIVRPVPAELDELARRDERVFGHTSLRAVDFSVITWAGAVYDARVAGETVGSCQLVRTWDDPTAAWVVGFYVLPESQGQGLGRELLRAVAAEAAACGLRRLLLTADPGNTRALKFYQSFGFLLSDSLPDFYGRGEDRSLLELRLPVARPEGDDVPLGTGD